MLQSNQPARPSLHRPQPAADSTKPGDRASVRQTVTAVTLTNLVLALLIVSLAGIAITVRFFYRPQVDPAYAEQVVSAVGERLQAHAPELEREVVRLGHDAWPIVQTALIEQARSDYPLYARALEQEGSEYFNNVEQAFVAKVKARYHDYLQRHRDILTSEFPEHATRENVEQILAAFEATFDELVDRYYIDQFRHEANRTEELWAAIPPAPQPQADEPPLEKQLGEVTRQWMVGLLRAPPPLPPPPPEANTPRSAASDATAAGQ
ncbi:MAG: hypothetical protein ACTHOU_05665 [Aureliella sp.]